MKMIIDIQCRGKQCWEKVRKKSACIFGDVPNSPIEKEIYEIKISEAHFSYPKRSQ